MTDKPGALGHVRLAPCETYFNWMVTGQLTQRGRGLIAVIEISRRPNQAEPSPGNLLSLRARRDRIQC